MRRVLQRRNQRRAVARSAPELPENAPPVTTPQDDERELACRRNDGLHIVLLWRPTDDGIVVAMDDSRTGLAYRFDVDRDSALDAFHHPFAYLP
jgi:hypothetical protein